MTMILCRLFLIFAVFVPGILHAQILQPAAKQPRDNSKFVVFIHAGGKDISEQSVRDIAVTLIKRQYVVSVPDRDRDEVGGPGVDYFSDTPVARDAAQEVADVVNERLRNLKILDEKRI